MSVKEFTKPIAGQTLSGASLVQNIYKKAFSKPFSKQSSIIDVLRDILTFKSSMPIPLIGNVVLDEGDLYCQQVYFRPCDCTYWAFNPSTYSFEELNQMSTKVGHNANAFSHESRPFTCEIHAPTGGGDVTVTNASILAAIAGATFQPSASDASDATISYLNEYELVLAHLNDEDAAGNVSTTCNAQVTDVETGKVKDLEPGGNYAAKLPLGRDVPGFSALVSEGSTVIVCGVVSNRINKSGAVVPKP